MSRFPLISLARAFLIVLIDAEVAWSAPQLVVPPGYGPGSHPDEIPHYPDPLPSTDSTTSTLPSPPPPSLPPIPDTSAPQSAEVVTVLTTQTVTQTSSSSTIAPSTTPSATSIFSTPSSSLPPFSTLSTPLSLPSSAADTQSETRHTVPIAAIAGGGSGGLLVLLALIYILWRKCHSRPPRRRIDLLQSAPPEVEKFLPEDTLLPARYAGDRALMSDGIMFSASSFVAPSRAATPEASLISSPFGSRVTSPLPPLPPRLHTRTASEESESAMLSSCTNTDSIVTTSRVAVSPSEAGSGKPCHAPSSSRRVLVVQHQDAGPSDRTPEPEDVETIELPPAYSELRPVAPPRKFVASPLAASSQGSRGRRPVTYSW